MARPIHVLYIGLHPGTLLLLDQMPFKVRGVALIPQLFRLSANPGDLLFQLAYRVLSVPRLSRWRWAACAIWRFASGLSSATYRRYAEYLRHIAGQAIGVVDADSEERLRAFIEAEAIELIVVNAWSILPPRILGMPKYGSVNIHPSCLPKYRGALPTLWALRNGDAASCVCILRLDE